MSLLFDAATEKVDHGVGTSLNNLSPWTICAWVKPNVISGDDRVYAKGLGSAQQAFNFESSNLTCFISKTAGNCSAAAAFADFAAYAANKWIFVAGQNDETTAGNNRLFLGDLLSAAAEPSSYGTQSTGGGSHTSNNGAAAIIGNRSSDNRNFDGLIAWVGIWNRLLSPGEILAQQFRPHKTSGCVLFVHLGFNGTGTQADWSGNVNNGTVTGATVADHVPLGPSFGLDISFASIPAAAAGGLAGSLLNSSLLRGGRLLGGVLGR